MAEFETAQFFFKNKTRHLLKHVMKCMRDIDAPCVFHHITEVYTCIYKINKYTTRNT